MENDLIDELVDETAAALKAALREVLSGASFEELVALRNGGSGGHSKTVKSNKKTSSSGKRVRRSEEEIQAQAAKIPAILRKHKDGAGAELICQELGIDRKDVPRLIAEALERKLISKRGEKRGTLYFAGGAKKSNGAKSVKKAPAKKAAKKSAPKKAKKPAKKAVAKSANSAAVASPAASE
jgi:hypothetical protein